MAKTRFTPSTSRSTHTTALVHTETAPIELSVKVRKLVDSIRSPFRSFTLSYAELTATRADLAPAFMKAFGAFQTETGHGFTDFVRFLDPSVGPTRADYRAHKAYQAADYLRRLVAQQARPKAATISGARSTTSPATPLDGMARLIASLLPLIGADQVPRLWEAVTAELHWTERQSNALQHRVEQSTPLVAVKPPRGATVPQLRIATVQVHADDTELRTGTQG